MAAIDPVNPKPYSIEYRIVLPDGALRWVHARGQAHFTGKGEARRTVSLVGAIADITEARLSHDALRESEARLQKLADAMPQMVFAARPDGHVDYFNRQWYAYTGLPEGEVGYESWKLVHTEEGLQRAMRDWPEAVRTGSNYEIEYRLRRHDGEYRWHLGRAVPVRDETGKIIRWFGTNTDIHDQKMAEESIRHSREQMEMVVKGANVGVWYCPLPLDRFVWDEKLKEHFHLAPDAEVTMQVFCDRIHPDDLAPTLAAIDRSIQERVPYDVDYRTLSADRQHTKWIRAIGRAFYDEEGTPLHFDGISVDVTERVEAERALRESEERLRALLQEREELLVSERAARAEAERASRLKDDFLATVSHELRTPLNAILGYAQLLRQGAVQPHKVSDGLEVIERNARIQAQIIEDILDMSRIVSGKMRLDVQRVELQSVVEAAMETVRPAADAKNIRLIRTVDPLAGPVSGDPNRLQQVVWNLLANAIKFTPKGGRIQIVLASVNSHVEVAVSDNGQGIKSDFLPYVFDKFRQADASMARKHGGLGLGLAIVKNFVEMHGGSVAVKSPGEGQGATFVVSIPISAVHASPEAEDRVHPRSPSPRRPDEDRPSLTSVSVLVVDDEADARELVRRLLEDCGARVMTAGSAEEAIGVLERERVDVLVSDIGMPGEDGYALIRRVRERGPERQGGIPAAALTAFARSEDRTRALKAGYQTHIAKPVEPVELMFAVATLVGKTGHG
jgi:PAS domain S-box-containing protein